MQQASSGKIKNTLSVMIFRLGEDWLALPTIYFKEVALRRPLHRIPHRSGKIFLGIVNLNGELQLCVNLHQLLGMESIKSSYANQKAYQQDRMIAIVRERDLWVTSVDEIDGIYNWDFSEVSLIKDISEYDLKPELKNYLIGIMKMDNKSVGLLDGELLFSSLKRSLDLLHNFQ